jgi:hypothetical protein
MRLIHCAATPLWIAPISVPLVGKLPAGLRAQYCAPREAPGTAPTVHVLFRPEEKHGLSIKYNIFPPATCGQGEMNYAVAH